MSMESKVNIYIYLSLLIIVLMIVSILIQVLLMKRILYFQRDFLEVGESNNRISSDPIGISQPKKSDASANKEQDYVFLKEHIADSSEESSVVKEKGQTFEPQKLEISKSDHKSMVKTESVLDKSSEKALVSSDKQHKVEYQKSVAYSQNIVSKKKPNQIQYNAIVLNQNAVEISKKERVNNKVVEKEKILVEPKANKVKVDSNNVDQKVLVLGGENVAIGDHIAVDQQLESAAISNSIEKVNSLSISEFVRTDVEQQDKNVQPSLDVSSNEVKVDQANIDELHQQKEDQKLEVSAETVVEKVEPVIENQEKELLEDLIVGIASNHQLNEDKEISSDYALKNLETSPKKADILTDRRHFNSLQLKATHSFPNEGEIQELVGLEKVLQTKNVITDGSNINFESKLSKQEEPWVENSALEESLPPHEQSLVIEDNVTNHEATDALEGESVAENEELISIPPQILVEEEVGDKDEIVFFSGVNSDFSNTVKNDSLSDILVLEKDILYSLEGKKELNLKTIDVTQNKANKLKLLDNVVKKLTSNSQQEVNAPLIQSNIENIESEVSFDGIRDTYQKIFNAYK